MGDHRTEGETAASMYGEGSDGETMGSGESLAGDAHSLVLRESAGGEKGHPLVSDMSPSMVIAGAPSTGLLLEMREPCEGKLSRTVLRGKGGRKAP